MNKPIKYIVAGNYNEYQAYVKRKTRDQVYYKYVSGVDTIRGLSEIDGCYIGSYASRKDIEAIKVHINIIKSKQTIDEIKPAKFEWKGAGPGVGIIAQEVGEVLPEAFFRAYNGGDIDQHIKTGYRALKDPVNIERLRKELYAEIDKFNEKNGSV